MLSNSCRHTHTTAAPSHRARAPHRVRKSWAKPNLSLSKRGKVAVVSSCSKCIFSYPVFLEILGSFDLMCPSKNLNIGWSDMVVLNIGKWYSTKNWLKHTYCNYVNAKYTETLWAHDSMLTMICYEWDIPIQINLSLRFKMQWLILWIIWKQGRRLFLFEICSEMLLEMW